MRAVVVDPDNERAPFRLAEIPDAERASEYEVLIGVRASALNQADRRKTGSHFAKSEQRAAQVAGLEVAGVVEEVGTAVEGVYIGDRVMAMTGGAWAEKVAIDHRLVIPIPASYDWREAGAAAISYVTAHDALTGPGALRPGHTVLVQGATSSAGLACVQLAPLLGAQVVFGTTRNEKNVELLAQAGCDIPICRATHNSVDVVEAATDGRGVNLVVDIVGASATQENVACVALQGRIVSLGRVGGREAVIDLDEFARKRISMVGTTFRTRTLEERFAVISSFRRRMVPRLHAEGIRPIVDRVFPIARIEDAFEYQEERHGRVGKIVLDIGGDLAA